MPSQSVSVLLPKLHLHVAVLYAADFAASGNVVCLTVANTLRLDVSVLKQTELPLEMSV